MIFQYIPPCAHVTAAVLYQRYPHNWPLFTPKDKLANWIEYYADAQDLIVWTSTKTSEDSYPVYDNETKRWTVTVDRAGQRFTLHPAHIVCCMGTLGKPIFPEVKNRDVFKGTVIHGSQYKSPTPFTNKRVVIVGAGNTACDICLDLSTCADTITMIQRSRSTLVPGDIGIEHLTRFWPDDGSVPTDIADFKAASTPLKLVRMYSRMVKAGGGGESGKYAELYKGLREKGMIVDDGEDGEGLLFQVFEKFGGTSIFYSRAISNVMVTDPRLQYVVHTQLKYLKAYRVHSTRRGVCRFGDFWKSEGQTWSGGG